MQIIEDEEVAEGDEEGEGGEDGDLPKGTEVPEVSKYWFLLYTNFHSATCHGVHVRISIPLSNVHMKVDLNKSA